MPSLRKIWDAWDQNPIAVWNRKYIYRVFGPLSLGGLVWMATIGEWAAAGFTAVLLGIAVESGARTPGTTVRRLFLHLRGRRGRT
jgi:hypothetical protein